MIYPTMDEAHACGCCPETLKRLAISFANNVCVDESHGRLPVKSSRKLQLEVQFGTLEDKAIRAAASWRRP